MEHEKRHGLTLASASCVCSVPLCLQDPVAGSSASDSLGCTRACATAGGCGAGLAVGFPGVPSCNGAAAGAATFKPGVTFLGSLTPVDNLASTVCTGTPDAAAVDPAITYGATVIYDAPSKTLAVWVTKASTTGAGDITQAPIFQQGSVDLCALLTPGAAAGAAPTGSFYLGFSSTSGDCSANPGSCTAYRALSMGFSSECGRGNPPPTRPQRLRLTRICRSLATEPQAPRQSSSGGLMPCSLRHSSAVDATVACGVTVV